jgi:hypothetical protein
MPSFQKEITKKPREKNWSEETKPPPTSTRDRYDTDTEMIIQGI